MRPAGRSPAEAYGSLGFISLYYDWTLEEARRAFEHALEISTGYVPAHMWLAAAHAADGKVDDAIAEANRAVTIEPLSSGARAHLAWLLYLGRYPAEAEAEALRALEIEPARGFSPWVLGQTRLALGRLPDAVDALERACELWPDSSWMTATRAWLLVAAGRATEALLYWTCSRVGVPRSTFARLRSPSLRRAWVTRTLPSSGLSELGRSVT